MSKSFIIAEAGVNHNGSLENALRLVDVAVRSGADAVKFQTFNSQALATSTASKAEYQTKAVPGDASMLKMLQELELEKNEFKQIQEYCCKAGIEFLSTPFDIESLDFLVDELGLKKIKIGSGDLTNALLLLKAAQKGCSIILSTGMGDLGDIQDALAVLAFGYLNKRNPTSYQEVKEHFSLVRPWDILKKNVSILHCVSNYPALSEEINLAAIPLLKKTFGLRTGYSDHTLGIEMSIAAVALGSEIIEKHITFDKNMSGPDHKASLEEAELISMVQSIRNVEKGLGDGHKMPMASEIAMAKKARRSIVANRAIAKDQIICAEDLAIKRPSEGLSPMYYWNIVGRKAVRNYEPEQSILEHSEIE